MRFCWGGVCKIKVKGERGKERDKEKWKVLCHCIVDLITSTTDEIPTDGGRVYSITVMNAKTSLGSYIIKERKGMRTGATCQLSFVSPT